MAVLKQYSAVLRTACVVSGDCEFINLAGCEAVSAVGVAADILAVAVNAAVA